MSFSPVLFVYYFISVFFSCLSCVKMLRLLFVLSPLTLIAIM